MYQPDNFHLSLQGSPCLRPDLKPLPSALKCCVTLGIWLSLSDPQYASFLSSGNLKESTAAVCTLDVGLVIVKLSKVCGVFVCLCVCFVF